MARLPALLALVGILFAPQMGRWGCAQGPPRSGVYPAAGDIPPGPPLPSGVEAAPRFPELPPAPGEEDLPPLPPLEQELWLHGGSYLYAPEGDRLNWPPPGCELHPLLRLPEDWQKPKPLTGCAEFLGADPIHPWPGFAWCHCGPHWEPRLVAYGSYELLGIAYEENRRRQNLVGHQLIADVDFRLTGTERLHVQIRPLGERNTGGSYYQFSEPEGYVDNSTLVPDRGWLELELASVLGGYCDPFAPLDYHVTLGKVPFALHNRLLIDDEMLGVIVTKNTLLVDPFSNILVQAFAFPDDVDAFAGAAADVYGLHSQLDYAGDFIELSYARLLHNRDSGRDADYLAGSYTRFFGPWSFAGRALLKFGDRSGIGSGQLFVLESNHTRKLSGACAHALGVEHGVFYCNLFAATDGWSSIARGGFDRLRSVFELDPLITISRRAVPGERYGAALGVQLFQHHEDSSLIPEIAYERPDGADTWGLSLRWLYKTGPRSFFEARGLKTFSSDPRFRRAGAFVSQTILF